MEITRRTFVAGAAAAAVASQSAAAALADAAGYVPGTYSATVPVMNKTLTVEMDFSTEAIDAAHVDASSESDFLGQIAAPIVAERIVEAQSPDVDVVAGATVTCAAVKRAARLCVAQARGEQVEMPEDDMVSPIPAVEPPAAWDYEADVALVGASCAGLVCAAKLAQGGKSVVVAEKGTVPGGCGRVTVCIQGWGGNDLMGRD